MSYHFRMVFVDTIKRFTVYEQLCVIYHRLVSTGAARNSDACPFDIREKAWYNTYTKLFLQKVRPFCVIRESTRITNYIITGSKASIKSHFRDQKFLLQLQRDSINYITRLPRACRSGDWRLSEHRRNFLLAVTSAVPITSP